MGRGWKNFEALDRKIMDFLRLYIEIWTLKLLLAGIQKNVGSVDTESLIILENTSRVINRLLLEIRMLKVVLVRTQKEMKNMLLGI